MSENQTPIAPQGTLIPLNFPYAQDLQSGGYATLEQLDEASDDDLVQVKGIGNSKVKTIREALEMRAIEDDDADPTESRGDATAPTERGSHEGVPEGETALPPDFPHRDILIAGGVTSLQQARALGDPTVVPGIRNEHVSAIRIAAGFPGATKRGMRLD